MVKTMGYYPLDIPQIRLSFMTREKDPYQSKQWGANRNQPIRRPGITLTLRGDCPASCDFANHTHLHWHIQTYSIPHTDSTILKKIHFIFFSIIHFFFYFQVIVENKMTYRKYKKWFVLTLLNMSKGRLDWMAFKGTGATGPPSMAATR